MQIDKAIADKAQGKSSINDNYGILQVNVAEDVLEATEAAEAAEKRAKVSDSSLPTVQLSGIKAPSSPLAAVDTRIRSHLSFCRTHWAFEATCDTELTLQPEDLILIRAQQGEWCRGILRDGRKGEKKSNF